MTRSGDVLQVGIPAAAFILTFFFDDEAGADAQAARPLVAGDRRGTLVDWKLAGSPRRDLVMAVVRTELTTYGLKYSISSERPNGGPHSFPSGHTAAAFTGAEFIRKQHGGTLGIAAYASATFVGWTRVVSGNHWTHDVVAGAAIGMLSNHDSLRWSGRFGDFSVASMLVEASGDGGADLAPRVGALVPTLQFRLSF